jgi:hypothetical protein
MSAKFEEFLHHAIYEFDHVMIISLIADKKNSWSVAQIARVIQVSITFYPNSKYSFEIIRAFLDNGLKLVSTIVQYIAGSSNSFLKEEMDKWSCDKTKIIKMLLEFGYSASKCSKIDETPPIFYAASSGTIEMCHDLITFGADFNQLLRSETILMHAICSMKPEIVAFFIEKSIRVNALNKDGETALNILAFKNYNSNWFEIFKLLVDKMNVDEIKSAITHKGLYGNFEEQIRFGSCAIDAEAEFREEGYLWAKICKHLKKQHFLNIQVKISDTYH